MCIPYIRAPTPLHHACVSLVSNSLKVFLDWLRPRLHAADKGSEGKDVTDKETLWMHTQVHLAEQVGS